MKSALHPVIRRFAASVAASLPPGDHEALARAFHGWVRDRIRYVPDGVMEELADEVTVLQRGYDDCDGKAALFVSLCRAVKLEARTLPVYRGGEFTHVAAEVRWRGGPWVRAEVILKGVELGQGLESATLDAFGNPALA